MVAPADVDRTGLHPALADFAPSPRVMLPFPSILVASRDDPWIGFDAARRLADLWGSHLVDAGAQGHLNAASGLGVWTEGQELLERVIAVSGGGGGRALRSAGDAWQALASQRGAEARE
jgi:predicted alpha/beta hydrolase family esterase